MWVFDFVGPDIPKEMDGMSLFVPSPDSHTCGKTNCSCTAPAKALGHASYPVQSSKDDPPWIDSRSSGGVSSSCAHECSWSHGANQLSRVHASTCCTQGSLQMFFHCGLYHDWLSDKTKGRGGGTGVDLVFAPNAGLEAYPEWKGSVDSFRAGPYCIVTDYCEEAIVRAAEMLRTLGLGAHNCGLNPFRQPSRDRRAGNSLPSCSNGFLLAVHSSYVSRGADGSSHGEL